MSQRLAAAFPSAALARRRISCHACTASSDFSISTRARDRAKDRLRRLGLETRRLDVARDVSRLMVEGAGRAGRHPSVQPDAVLAALAKEIARREARWSLT